MATPIADSADAAISFLETLADRFVTLWSENDWTAWATLLASIFVGLTVGRLTAWGLGRIARRYEAADRPGRAQAVLALAGPASLAIFTFGLSIGLAGLRLGDKGEALPQFAAKTLLLLYTIAAFWYAYNLVDVIDVVVRQFARGADSALQRQVVLLLSRSLRVFLLVVGALVVAESVFHQDIGAWLAGLGIAGLAVSLAAQDSLKNFFGSVSILLDRSFRLGDRIIIGGYDGTIEDIGFRSTKIRTAAGHLVTLPNSNVMNSAIENVSRRHAVRRVITLSIPGRTPSEKLREAVAALGRIFDEEDIRGPVRPFVDGVERTPRICFEDIQAGNFRVTITYWHAPAPDAAHSTHTERVNLRIVEELGKAGVELA